MQKFFISFWHVNWSVPGQILLRKRFFLTWKRIIEDMILVFKKIISWKPYESDQNFKEKERLRGCSHITWVGSEMIT